MSDSRLDVHPVYQSLIEKPLYGGVDKRFLIAETSVIGSVFLGAGFHLSTFGVALVWGIILHPLMVWICSIDPLLPALYIRSLRSRDFYVASTSREVKPPRIRSSIPHLR